MSYNVHNFEDGQILHAAPLNEMDEQISQNKDSLTELSGDFSAVVEKRTVSDNLFTYWIENKRYKSSDGSVNPTNNARYIASQPIDIHNYLNVNLYCKGFPSDVAINILLYDINNGFLIRQTSFTGNVQFRILNNSAYYMIFASAGAFATDDLMNEFIANNHTIVSDDESAEWGGATQYIVRNSTIEKSGKLEDSELPITSKAIYNFLKPNMRPMVTWIDDDTSSLARLVRVKNVADSVGIKPTLACITKYIEGDLAVDGVKDKLLELQNEYGYHITTHSQEHSDIWKSWQTGIYNASECEKSLIKSIMDLQKNGFLECDYLVSPFGECTPPTQFFTKKWCKCLLNAGANNTGLNYLPTDSKWSINRCLVQASDGYTLEHYTSMIDEAISNNAWLIFFTHLGSEDVSLITNILQYAVDNNVEISTLSSAFRERNPVYDFNEVTYKEQNTV